MVFFLWIICHYSKFGFCVHRWQGSGTWSVSPLMPSGSSAAGPAWRWAPPCSPQLQRGTWTSPTAAWSECERLKIEERGKELRGKLSTDMFGRPSVQPWWILLENEQPGQEDRRAWEVHLPKWAWVHARKTYSTHTTAPDTHDGSQNEAFLPSHDLRPCLQAGATRTTCVWLTWSTTSTPWCTPSRPRRGPSPLSTNSTVKSRSSS